MKAGKLIVLTLLAILLLSTFACGGNSLASNPQEVYKKVESGMWASEVYELVDPDYARGSVWVVGCSDMYEGDLVYYDALDPRATHYMWIFMPEYVGPQATIVYIDGTTDWVVTRIRIDWSDANNIILAYGDLVFW